MMSQIMSEHRRLAILRHLAEASGHVSNISILADVCTGLGVTTSRDQCLTEAHWLGEQGLVLMNEDQFVLQATARGVDVAQGRARVPGIKRPTPRS